MTAEIGVLNKNGVALAADSAVTITNKDIVKVLNSANKLFNLSNYHPVGIMIYGNGDYMGIPWEIIIKEYREYLGRKPFDTLEGYCNDFFEFLFESGKFHSKTTMKQLASRLFDEQLNIILQKVNKDLFNKHKSHEPPIEDVQEILSARAKELLNQMLEIEDIN